MRRLFYGLGIKPKIIVLVTLLIGGTVALISGTIAYNVQRSAETNAKQAAEETAWRYANTVKNLLNAPLDETRAVGKLFEATLNTPETRANRDQALLVLKYILEHTPDIIGMCLLFEPDAFDGRDRDFAGKPGHDHSGRFIPYWYKNAQGQTVLEPLLDYESSEYYQLPKQTKREAITEPYVYPVQGKDVLMTTVVTPVLDTDKNFLGIVTMDLTLEKLQEFITGIEIAGFEHAYVNLFSAKGVVVASQNPAYVGKRVNEITDSQDLVDAVLHARPALIERVSRTLGDRTFSYVAPVEIGHSGIYWTVTVNIAAAEIMARANRLLWLIGSLGAGAILVSALFTWLLARLLVAPLKTLKHHLHSLAQGRLLAEPVHYAADDEIGGMVQAYRRLKEGIQATIGQANAVAQGDYSREVQLLSEEDQLGLALRSMTVTLREVTANNAAQDWLKSGQAQLAEKMSGEQSLVELAENIVTFLTEYVGAQMGLCYVLAEANRRVQAPHLELLATYACVQRKHLANEFALGEGLVGQAALERKTILLTEVPEDYAHIQSGLGNAVPRNVLAMPFLYENTLKGVLELGTLEPLSELQLEFLRQVMPAIGIAVNTTESRMKMQKLLEKMQGGQ